eukprot:364068-Chlamydomonas_euryale.AAC.6
MDREREKDRWRARRGGGVMASACRLNACGGVMSCREDICDSKLAVHARHLGVLQAHAMGACRSHLVPHLFQVVVACALQAHAMGACRSHLMPHMFEAAGGACPLQGRAAGARAGPCVARHAAA